MSTMSDVARLANVSETTVSRVINNKIYVKEETRKKINEAIEKLNYVPNQMASSLARTSFTGPSIFVGIIVPDILSSFYSTLVTQISNSLRKKGFQSILAFCNLNDWQTYTTIISEMKKINIAGIISADYNFQEYPSDEIPVILFNSGKQDDKIYSINFDEYTGGVKSVQAIEVKKPKKVIVQRGLQSKYVNQTRFNGIISKLSEDDIHFQIQDVTGTGVEDAVNSADKLFKNYTNFDAVISINDLNALKIIELAREINISVPGELQVVGYGNSISSDMLDVKISTISTDPLRMGKLIAGKIMKVIIGTERQEMKEKINVDFIKGDTTE